VSLRGTTVLITGGCGLIGSSIADLLADEEGVAEIRIVDNLSRGTLLNLENARRSGNVRLIEADIRDSDAIADAFHGVDVVFHQAAIRITACAEQWRECHDVLVTGTLNVVEGCLKAGVRKLIAASSASVYGAADVFPTAETHHLYSNRTWYGAAKIANEALYRAFHDMAGLDYVALRYFNVYGPRMDVFGKYTEVLIRWLDCLDRGTAPKIFGDGSQTMDFVFVEDVARANISAAKSKVTDRVFNVGTGTETSLLELLEMLLVAADREDVVPEFLPARQVNPVARRLADVSLAREVLGFEASTSLLEGLRRLIRWRGEVVSRGLEEHYDPHR